MRTYLLTLTAIFLVLASCIIHADPPATQPATQPPVITGTLGKPEATAKAGDTAKIATVLGHTGVLFIRSEARWDELNKLLPDLTPDTPLPKLDFAKQSAVFIYATSRRPREELALSKSDLAANPPHLNFMLIWNNLPLAGEEPSCSMFILAIIPAAPTVRVTVSSIPLNRDVAPVATEFSAILGGKDGADIVDGLQASITPKAATIKPGDDIEIDMDLHVAQMPDAKPEQFGFLPKSIYVWDAVDPHSYQTIAYFVTSPEGKTRRLQRPAQEFMSNKPRPVEITTDNRYHLSSDADNKPNFISLKARDLDTTTPGTYTITGLFEETLTSKTKPMWGGSITSNTITVEVKK